MRLNKMKIYAAVLLLILFATAAHAEYSTSKPADLRARIEKEIIARNELLEKIGASQNPKFKDVSILIDVNSYELTAENLLKMLEAFLDSLNQGAKNENPSKKQDAIKKFKDGATWACMNISYQMGIAVRQVSNERVRARAELQHSNIDMACKILSGIYKDEGEIVNIY